jgi:hypothetical protein
LTQHELEAVRMLGVYTAKTFKLVHLTGKHRAAHRAHVMSELCGVKMPQSKSGITAIREALYKLSGVTGNCEAEQQDNLREWCKQIESEQKWLESNTYGRLQS